MKLHFFFAWYDFWVGWYWDRKKRMLYICPLPMVVFALEFKPKRVSVQGLGVGFGVRGTGRIGPDGVVEEFKLDSVSLVPAGEDSDLVISGNNRVHLREAFEKGLKEHSVKLRK